MRKILGYRSFNALKHDIGTHVRYRERFPNLSIDRVV